MSQYEISFLPPLLLNFDLPEDYPSSSPPSFTLTCSWLSHTQVIFNLLLLVTFPNGHGEKAVVAEDPPRLRQSIYGLLPQLSVLSAQLIDIYLATGGTVVLFTWVQFLKEDALSFLGIHNHLELQSDECQAANHQPVIHPSPGSGPAHSLSCNPTGHCEEDCSASHDLSASAPSQLPSHTSEPISDNGSLPNGPGKSPEDADRSISTFLSPLQRLLTQILMNDADQQQRRFASTVFECGVCFMSQFGSDCVKLPECGHIFCQACLTEFCKVQITEGNVRGVACPQGDCSSAPTPAQVRSFACSVIV